MAGLLGDIYSTLDSYKRRGKALAEGLLTDPEEVARQHLANMRQEAGGNRAKLSAMYQDPSGRTTLKPSEWSPQAAAAEKALADEMAGAVMGATVWHGSPHIFDRFDSKKIGTGEGAQVYGHGLYVAESPAVAKHYRESLSPAEFVMKDGSKYNPDNPLHWAAAELHDAVQAGKSPIRLAQEMREREKSLRARHTEWAAMEADKLRDAWQRIATQPESLPPIDVRLGGALYKADLADEALPKMLDWDKQLSAQSPHVLRAAGWTPKVDAAYKASQATADEALLAALEGRSSTPLPKVQAPPGAPSLDMTGREFYTKKINEAGNSLYDRRGPMWEAIANDPNRLMYQPADLATKALREAGVPGIRYLDEMSRGGGGSSNFVVFPGNEGLLQILERNGEPLIGRFK